MKSQISIYSFETREDFKLLKKVTPDIIGKEDPTSLFIKIERDLKNKLRGLK